MHTTVVRKKCVCIYIYKENNSYHVETKETVTQEHLDLLIMSGQIAMRIASSVLVGTSPLIAGGGKLVCS